MGNGSSGIQLDERYMGLEEAVATALIRWINSTGASPGVITPQDEVAFRHVVAEELKQGIGALHQGESVLELLGLNRDGTVHANVGGRNVAHNLTELGYSQIETGTYVRS